MSDANDYRFRWIRVVAYAMYGGEVTCKVLRDKFDLSPASAKRMMLDLERAFPDAIIETRPIDRSLTNAHPRRCYRVLRLSPKALLPAAA